MREELAQLAVDREESESLRRANKDLETRLNTLQESVEDMEESFRLERDLFVIQSREKEEECTSFKQMIAALKVEFNEQTVIKESFRLERDLFVIQSREK